MVISDELYSRTAESSVIDSALKVLKAEMAEIESLKKTLSDPGMGSIFESVVDAILNNTGKVVVTGLGKSGHIARKIAATLASTGTPAFFLHGAEAVHGDLGMIGHNDVVIILSYSGKTSELLTMATYLQRKKIPLVAITGNPASELAAQSSYHLCVRVEQEACPLNLAPTSSTTVMLVLGDALAVSLLEARQFSTEDFAQAHPGGTLGRRLLTYARDVMRPLPDLPIVAPDTKVFEALLPMSNGRLGMVLVMNHGMLEGIFTDGDLRRLLENRKNIYELTMKEVFIANPIEVRPDELAMKALDLMREKQVSQLLVMQDSVLLGALNIHDLLQLGADSC